MAGHFTLTLRKLNHKPETYFRPPIYADLYFKVIDYSNIFLQLFKQFGNILLHFSRNGHWSQNSINGS